MDVLTVLHMNGGMGETSYSKNSLLQRKVIQLTKHLIEQATADFYRAIATVPKTLSIAELGCSSGPNAFLAAAELMKVVDNIRLEKGHCSPEYQVYFNDLPKNDFNSILISTPGFQKQLKEHMGRGFGPCFFNCVPGSFYGRLFPSKSLHFVHSSYSLMWLSQVPEGADNNKRNIYMSGTSPPSVIEAYYRQFQLDFSQFLKCRSEEVVSGGRMLLTFLGRRSDDPCSSECSHIWELLAAALNDMVEEGLIEEEKLYSFNLPQYTPSATELKIETEKEASFEINCLESSEISWNVDCEYNKIDGGGHDLLKSMRAVAEPLIVSHFGEVIVEDVFVRYGKILSDLMAKERPKFINVTISVTRK